MNGEVKIGPRLRYQRKRKGLSQRELAQRVGVTPSAISQVELDQTKPSVSTLLAIVTELDVSLDWIYQNDERERPPLPGSGGLEPDSLREVVARGHAPRFSSRSGDAVIRDQECAMIELESGVRWERLSNARTDVDFLRVTYPAGSSSSSEGAVSRHNGYEFGHVLAGCLGVQIKFDNYELHPGDSVSFDSQHPHRMWAIGDESVHAIWMVLGRAST
jgi:transcriptional regulator with XRE-family HTH domain